MLSQVCTSVWMSLYFASSVGRNRGPTWSTWSPGSAWTRRWPWMGWTPPACWSSAPVNWARTHRDGRSRSPDPKPVSETDAETPGPTGSRHTWGFARSLHQASLRGWRRAGGASEGQAGLFTSSDLNQVHLNPLHPTGPLKVLSLLDHLGKLKHNWKKGDAFFPVSTDNTIEKRRHLFSIVV